MFNVENIYRNEKRIIFHIDFDYFFAQCEEIRNPSIKDMAVVICVFSGRTKESGVVSTANYIARKYGIKSGIPIKFAKAKLKNFALAKRFFYQWILNIIKLYPSKHWK